VKKLPGREEAAGPSTRRPAANPMPAADTPPDRRRAARSLALVKDLEHIFVKLHLMWYLYAMMNLDLIRTGGGT
jgi:hypothetical protein